MVTYPQYLVMIVLWERDYITLSNLGERLKLDSGTLTPLLKRLEGSGFLHRKSDVNDGRKVRLTLTAKGIMLHREAEQVPALAATATGCDFSELDGLTAQIPRLRDSIVANLVS